MGKYGEHESEKILSFDAETAEIWRFLYGDKFRLSDIAVIRLKFREIALDSGSLDLLLCQGIILK